MREIISLSGKINEAAASAQNAIRSLSPNTDYADSQASLFESIDGWEKVVPFLYEGNYFVVFESIRKASFLRTILLNAVDALAQSEAKNMPGYKGYYSGPLDSQSRTCRSFCVWENQESSRASGEQTNHRRAVRLTKMFYETYTVKRFTVTERQTEGDTVLVRLQRTDTRST